MNEIQLIKSDVKDFIDNRLRREDEYHSAVCDIHKSKNKRLYNTHDAETQIMHNANMCNTIDSLDYVIFKDIIGDDFKRVFSKLYMIIVDVPSWFKIRLGFDMYFNKDYETFNKLWTELGEIQDTILTKTEHHRFKYSEGWQYQGYGRILKPFKNTLKEDKILQSVYDGTIFEHVEKVLREYVIRV